MCRQIYTNKKIIIRFFGFTYDPYGQGHRKRFYWMIFADTILSYVNRMTLVVATLCEGIVTSCLFQSVYPNSVTQCSNHMHVVL